MTEYDSPAKLAAHAGLAPVSRDSGTVSGNHRQPRRYHRRLRHILWMAAFTAARECPALPRVLREKARRRKEPPASHSRPRPTTRRRPLGTHPRPQNLRPTDADSPRRSLNQHAPADATPIAPATPPCPP
ncbi:IS110 family transposase [Micromonospora sp. AMSO12t]|uniref:IS110 family transposase n=1 Tax=Micromonospora sp. AMSO12t TaxID=2650410 RepID=UPI002108565E|nr:IS110 family transposase [Micromonospora sp. AMSO12t]